LVVNLGHHLAPACDLRWIQPLCHGWPSWLPSRSLGCEFRLPLRQACKLNRWKMQYDSRQVRGPSWQ
jgi:hypothetical protein